MENMTKFMTELIDKYKPLVQPGELTIPELCDFMERNMSAVRIDFNLVNELTRKIMLKSIDCYIESIDKGLTLDKLQFIAYEIPCDGAGAEYYNYRHIPLRVEGHDYNSIYVIFEKHLEDYINCNCNKLALDLRIKKGISEYDYNHNTLRLIDYLTQIAAIENQWY